LVAERESQTSGRKVRGSPSLYHPRDEASVLLDRRNHRSSSSCINVMHQRAAARCSIKLKYSRCINCTCPVKGKERCANILPAILNDNDFM